MSNRRGVERSNSLKASEAQRHSVRNDAALGIDQQRDGVGWTHGRGTANEMELARLSVTGLGTISIVSSVPKKKRGGAERPEVTRLDVLRAIEAAIAWLDRAIAKYDSPIQAVDGAQVGSSRASAGAGRPEPKPGAKASRQRSAVSPTKPAADLRRETQALRRWTQALRRSKTLTPQLARRYAELKRRHPGGAPPPPRPDSSG